MRILRQCTPRYCVLLWNYSARFREFDFGNEEENMDEYGSPEPPEYRLVMVQNLCLKELGLSLT